MIENFGGNVSRLRKERGLSQENLAEKIGVNKQTISNIERGVRYPTFETLEKIATVFKVNSVQLFGTEEEIALLDASQVMDRIDDNEDVIERMVKFAKVFNQQYLNEINEAYQKAAYIHELFTKQPLRDKEGRFILSETNEAILQPAFFDTLPTERLDELIHKINYIKANEELL